MFCKAKYCSGDQQPRERRLHQRRPPRQLLAHHRPLVFLRHKSLNLTSDSKLPRRNSWSNFNVTKTTFFFRNKTNACGAPFKNGATETRSLLCVAVDVVAALLLPAAASLQAHRGCQPAPEHT